MKKQMQININKNIEIAKNIHKMEFKAPSISNTAMPGQFIHVRCSEGYRPLLRRPFSIMGVQGEDVKIIYKVVGKGTQLLSGLEQGDMLDVLGPLGESFSLPQDGKKVIVVGGGVGVAPLSFLIDFMVEKKVNVLDNIILILGVKNSQELILQEKFSNRELIDLHLVTEDGSKGEKGTAIDKFKTICPNSSNNKTVVYGGGPKPMLKELSHICNANDIYGEIAYENVMACGVGACLGCVVKTNSGLKRVCRDGPVFEVSEIKW